MKIPITFNYDKSKQIGQAVIETEDTQLAKLLQTGEYTFRAGFEILEKEGNVITKANLKEISLIPLPEKYGYKQDKKK